MSTTLVNNLLRRDQPVVSNGESNGAEKENHSKIAIKEENNNNSDSNGKLKKKSAKDKKKEKKKEKQRKKKKDKKKKEDKEESETKKEDNVEIEYITQIPEDPAFAEFTAIFEKFNRVPEEEVIQVEKAEEKEVAEEEEDDGKPKISRKQKKREKRISVAVLKTLVKRPDVVEAWDVTAADPALLVHLKSARNSVPVPRHWSQKRRYLQGKRGIEKPPFQLPEFIAATGISKIRQSIQADENKKLKTKQREKMQPKMGKMDIDYQVLHDAFFKYQTKPKLTIHGDLYYEGKEFEITLREKRPGGLSEELKRALGMPEGAPPPWLINMQRYGPPPSYPNLKVPGLNAPIPEGARYGYHAGGWGKPPVDEFGRPLYGDVFGTAPPEPPPEITEPIQRQHWGGFEAEEEEEVVEEQEQPQEEEPLESGFETPSGLETPSSGVETPDTLELRKTVKRDRDEEDDSGKQLYQVVQQQNMAVGSALMGSSHKYIIPSGERREKSKNTVDTVFISKERKGETVEVALDPSEVEKLEQLNPDVLKKKYDSKLAEKQEIREDVSDIIAEHTKKKRKKETKDKDKSGKKYKDFKF